MSELLDKAERARFLAVQRMRRADPSAADLLDLALLLEDHRSGDVSLNCSVTPEGARLDVDLGEMSANWLESAEEEDVADRLAAMIRQASDDA